MKPRDYKCYECNTIREIWVPDTEDFPEEVPCYECEGTAKKTFSAPHTIIHLGSVGNATNGYASTGGNIKKSKESKE